MQEQLHSSEMPKSQDGEVSMVGNPQIVKVSLFQLHQKKIPFLIVGLLILALSSSVFLWFYNRPENKIKRSILTTISKSSFLFDGTISLEYEPTVEITSLKTPIILSSAVVGMYDRNKNQPEFSTSLTINARDISVAQLELKKVENTLFLFFTALSDLGFIQNEKIEGQWISIDITNLPPGYLDRFLPPKFTLSADQLKRSSLVLNNYPLFTIQEEFPYEQGEGQRILHYRLQPSNENIILFLSTFISDADRDTSNLVDIISELEFKNVELWINPRTNLITRIRIEVTRLGKERNSPRVTIKSDITLKNYDQTVNIHTPKSSTPLNTIIDEISAAFPRQ